MKPFDLFILYNFIKEMKELNYPPNLLETDTIWQYRFICYKLNYFMKKIPLPNIKPKLFYEAVLVEFRILPNLEFILRNAIYKLGNEWSYTIICGLNNYEYLFNICNSIHKNINIICLEINNLTQNEYSKLLMSDFFWNMLHGEKILIYQEDSLIFKKNIKDFINYDYVGAPFKFNSDDTPNGVGNGGLSLRTKIKMIEILQKCKLEDLNLGDSTRKYMELMNLDLPPEDVYFSKNMQKYNIGDVAEREVASYFSSEQIFNPNSFGGHKFWISNSNWRHFIKKKFNYKEYKDVSNIDKYLQFKKLPAEYNKNKTIPNAFDVDLEFFCYVNNIEHINDITTLDYINKFGLDGFIYHPKQLYNIFNNITLYTFLNNIFIFEKNDIITVQEYINKYLYNSTFDYISNLILKKKHYILNDNYNTLLLVFLGNENIGIDLLLRIIQYKNINKEFNIAFCINNKLIKDKSRIKKMIKDNFDFYAIYYSKECGTDITPTLLMYNDISKTHKNIKHIIKLHTKTIEHVYINTTNYLLQTPLNQIINSKQNNCNCIGPPDNYINLSQDLFNNYLKKKYYDQINIDFSFVGGTIFYTSNEVFNKVLNFIKINNYRAYLLNNLYENNTINQEFSPIHFLERLFGVIKL